jgi:phosphoribosylformylglycinamidine synthase
MLFSESPSRIIISLAPSALAAVENIAAREHCPFTVIGQVGGSTLRIMLGEAEAVAVEVSELENAWRDSLGRHLETEVMAAGRE